MLAQIASRLFNCMLRSLALVFRDSRVTRFLAALLYFHTGKLLAHLRGLESNAYSALFRCALRGSLASTKNLTWWQQRLLLFPVIRA